MAGGLSLATNAKIGAAADAAYALRDDIMDMLASLQDAVVSGDRDALARTARAILRSSLRAKAGEVVIATRLVEIATRPPVALVVNNAGDADATHDDAPLGGGPGSGLTPPATPRASPTPAPRARRTLTPDDTPPRFVISL